MSRQEMLSHFNDILRRRRTKRPASSGDSGGSGAQRGRSRTVRGDPPIENNETTSDNVIDTRIKCTITKWINQKSPPGEATSTLTPGLSSARSQRGKKRTSDIPPTGSSRLDPLLDFLRDSAVPVLTQAEADKRLDSLSNSFKKIMNRDVSQSLHAVMNDIYALVYKGNRYEEVLKCLGDVANEYLFWKSGTVFCFPRYQSLFEGINHLWLKWQKRIESLSLTFMMVRNRKEYSEDNVRRLLLNAFKDNVIIPNESGRRSKRGQKRTAPPVYVINQKLRMQTYTHSTSNIRRFKPIQLTTQNSYAVKSYLAMLKTLGLDPDMIFVGLRSRFRA
jgi:hypothetical protein